MTNCPLFFDGQLKRFDVTIPASQYESWELLHKKLIAWCTKFVFQLERGDTGYEHWQVRLQLIHKKTCPSLKADVISAIHGHWSVTSTNVHVSPKAFNYCMKEDTRLEGPWDDTSIMEEKPPLTWQLEEFISYPTFLPWQQQLMDHITTRTMREINLVYDPAGHHGKSLFSEFLEYQGLAWEMPPLRSLEDLMEFAHSFPPKPCYLIDMPRALKKNNLSEFYAGIEVLKNGVTYDRRYSGKKRRMDRPNIVCFTNILPDFRFMTTDRWAIWHMQENQSLVRKKPEDFFES